MLFLLFQLGGDRYAMEAAKIATVLPLVVPKAIPQAPPAVVGAFDYRGTPVPLIDLSVLAVGRPSQPRRSTRVLVANYPVGAGETRWLGLIAEQAVETVVVDPAQFVPSGVDNGGARYLGPVASDARGLLQWVQIEHLLPDALRDQLFTQAVAS